MQPDTILQLTQQMLILCIWLSLPIVLIAALIGLLWALLQAVTQLQDQSSAFAIKLIVVIVSVAALSGWAGPQLKEYTTKTFGEMIKVRR